VYSFHSVDKLIIGHLISMDASKNATEHKLLPVQEKLDIMNEVKAAQNVSWARERKKIKNIIFVCQLQVQLH
jgi:hypothetical protein